MRGCASTATDRREARSAASHEAVYDHGLPGVGWRRVGPVTTVLCRPPLVRGVKRPAGYVSLLLALASAVGAWASRSVLEGSLSPATVQAVSKGLLGLAVVSAAYGVYLLLVTTVVDRATSKRRRQDVRNALRLVLVLAATVALFAVVTEQWVGLILSLGVVGFAVTFALQQPLFSLIAWVYILVNRPYGVGDRVAIEGSKGDVVEVDLFVTTLWEIGGDLVSTNQPSGRIVTVPNSVVLSSHVTNYTREEFPYVWNELAIQVAYETDLEFARDRMRAVADDYLGEEMARNVAAYREQIAASPVDLEVHDRPTVNVRQEESWVELRLRYLVHPRRGQRVRNALYERVLAEFNDHPDRVSFPLGRNR